MSPKVSVNILLSNRISRYASVFIVTEQNLSIFQILNSKGGTGKLDDKITVDNKERTWAIVVPSS